MNDEEKIEKIPLWDLGIEELVGHNIETKGRQEVNEKLRQGWLLLHLYTLTYKEDGSWRERPMAILGLPKHKKKVKRAKKETFVSL